jgi:hypothetical protein
MYLLLGLMLAGILLVLAVLVALDRVWHKNVHLWLPAYIRERSRRRDPGPAEEVHLILCVADHFEPRGTNPTPEAAQELLQRWVRDYPRLFGPFRDSDGRPPRHTFFYPIDEYDPGDLEQVAKLCRQGFGEVEVHLHHEDDTADELRGVLLAWKRLLANKHGLLPVHRRTGEVMYGFIHGNWALDNSLPDGKHCGVDNELDVLRETGCYADFTLPSAPSLAQTRTINRIYYASDDPQKIMPLAGGRGPKSHDAGVPLGSGPPPDNSLLLIQGPLLLDWQRRQWGLIPRIENACLQGSQPPTLERLRLWLRARIQAPTRPDWFFVKLHAHGGDPQTAKMFLGEPMVRFHAALAEHARQHPHFHYHYVTAREMYNLVKAAEAGWQGNVADALDFELIWRETSGKQAESNQTSLGAV